MADKYYEKLVKIRLRGDTYDNWSANSDQVLLKGEVGYALLAQNSATPSNIDSSKDSATILKIGDGTTPWEDLGIIHDEVDGDYYDNTVFFSGRGAGIQPAKHQPSSYVNLPLGGVRLRPTNKSQYGLTITDDGYLSLWQENEKTILHINGLYADYVKTTNFETQYTVQGNYITIRSSSADASTGEQVGVPPLAPSERAGIEIVKDIVTKVTIEEDGNETTVYASFRGTITEDKSLTNYEEEDYLVFIDNEYKIYHNGQWMSCQVVKDSEGVIDTQINYYPRLALDSNGIWGIYNIDASADNTDDETDTALAAFSPLMTLANVDEIVKKTPVLFNPKLQQLQSWTPTAFALKINNVLQGTYTPFTTDSTDTIFNINSFTSVTVSQGKWKREYENREFNTKLNTDGIDVEAEIEYNNTKYTRITYSNDGSIWTLTFSGVDASGEEISVVPYTTTASNPWQDNTREVTVNVNPWISYDEDGNLLEDTNLQWFENNTTLLASENRSTIDEDGCIHISFPDPTGYDMTNWNKAVEDVADLNKKIFTNADSLQSQIETNTNNLQTCVHTININNNNPLSAQSGNISLNFQLNGTTTDVEVNDNTINLKVSKIKVDDTYLSMSSDTTSNTQTISHNEHEIVQLENITNYPELSNFLVTTGMWLEYDNCGHITSKQNMHVDMKDIYKRYYNLVQLLVAKGVIDSTDISSLVDSSWNFN